MNSRSSFALAFGFGSLIVLIAVLGFGAIRRADTMYWEMQAAQDSYSQTEAFRRGIASDMYLADILVRDYLMDPSPESTPHHRQELLAIRDSLQQRLDQLSSHMPDVSSPGMGQLQTEVEAYWDSLDPIFEWSAKEKAERSWVFLARKVLPRREAVVSLAREVARLNTDNLEKERQRLQNSQQVLHKFLLQMMGVALGIGIFVALLTTHRVVVLERRHDAQRKQIEETQNNLRRLSQRLVQAQEVERRALSRELHDEVGQMMTALGIQLGNLDAFRTGDELAFRNHLEDAKRLNAGAMRALRDLAMGLRPSMLDDLGLQAALEWQGREFSRHTGVPANVQVHGMLDDLTDAQRTCIYRVVQEALTNCARHANARKVVVSVRADDNGIVVVVRDDGIGFKSAASVRGGLGLLGIQERVQALAGESNLLKASERDHNSGPTAGWDLRMTTKKIRVLIADDHGIVRKGLRLQLEQNSAFEVVGEATDGREAVRMSEELVPDVVIMDIAMPNLNGIQATAQLVKKNPQIGVIILSMYSDETYLTRTLAVGAKGYLLKESADLDLHNAVLAVAQGKPFFSPAIANTLLEDYMRQLQQRGLQDTYDLLTEREKEILQLLAEGRSNKDVASFLSLSTNTVETHRTRIMQKLDLHSSAEIVLYAVRKRIIS